MTIIREKVNLILGINCHIPQEFQKFGYENELINVNCNFVIKLIELLHENKNIKIFLHLSSNDFFTKYRLAILLYVLFILQYINSLKQYFFSTKFFFLIKFVLNTYFFFYYSIVLLLPHHHKRNSKSSGKHRCL